MNALEIFVKASVILAGAAAADVSLRRRGSASTRHAIWALAVVGLLLLPALSITLPAWRLPLGGAPSAAVALDGVAVADPADAQAEPARAAVIPWRDAASTGATPPAASPAWPGVLFAVYLAGLIGMLAHVVSQRLGLRRMLSETSAVSDPEWTRLLHECAGAIGVRRPVRLVRSRARSMPMTAGTSHPAIVIPAIADTWPEDRRRAVVLHELAHVARFDCLTQTLALLACAIYWFHPAAWWAARRLRVERELACDDRVLAAGTPARDYAGHLLEIAYAFGSHSAPALAVSMARPRQLEGRMLAVLDGARNRRVPARRSRLVGAGIAALLIVPLATVTATMAAPDLAEEAAMVETVPPAETATMAPLTTMAPLQVRRELRSNADRLRRAGRRLLREAAAAFGLQAQPKGAGTWEVRQSKANDGTVHLQLTEGDSSWGRTVRLDALEGLTATQLSGGGPVQFTLRRDAGTFTFKGVVQGGVGAGTFSFAADPAFAEGLAKRGFARPTASEQYALARADVGYAFLDELTKQGYAKPTTAELVRAGEHGVHSEYLREMGALGYRLGTLAPLIELRDHGVNPAYVKALAEQGYKGLPAEDLRRARDHGVSAEYVRALAEAGHAKLPIDALVNARDHGVSGEYARGMRALGYQVPLADLVRARDHGVSDDYVRELAALGYRGQPIGSLIRLRDHGVTPRYVQELKSLGYEGLSIDDLVRLRDHGLNAERIRAANARAGTRLPVEQLIRLQD